MNMVFFSSQYTFSREKENEENVLKLTRSKVSIYSLIQIKFCLNEHLLEEIPEFSIKC